jgi:hypothetical protein
MIKERKESVYLYMEYYSAIKRYKIMSFSGKLMEVEIIMLSKISQVQKDKGHIFSLRCGS